VRDSITAPHWVSLGTQEMPYPETSCSPVWSALHEHCTSCPVCVTEDQQVALYMCNTQIVVVKSQTTDDSLGPSANHC